MQNESVSLPEQTCQWCSGRIPENASACEDCGAARPRPDLTVPGYSEPAEPVIQEQAVASTPADQEDDAARARQILKDLDAYVPEVEPEYVPRARDPSDDILMIVLVLGASGIVGGLLGWFVAPPVIHDLFNEVLNVDTDGPEAFRRLGAFMIALLAMLFGSMLVAFMRR
jgi:hypothetical protein